MSGPATSIDHRRHGQLDSIALNPTKHDSKRCMLEVGGTRLGGGGGGNGGGLGDGGGGEGDGGDGGGNGGGAGQKKQVPAHLTTKSASLHVSDFSWGVRD